MKNIYPARPPPRHLPHFSPALFPFSSSSLPPPFTLVFRLLFMNSFFFSHFCLLPLLRLSLLLFTFPSLLNLFFLPPLIFPLYFSSLHSSSSHQEVKELCRKGAWPTTGCWMLLVCFSVEGAGTDRVFVRVCAHAHTDTDTHTYST